GIAVRLRDAAEGVLGAGAVLHREDADPVSRRDPADRVGHVQPGALLAHDDRPDVRLRGRLDDLVDRIADEELDALGFQNLCDGLGDFHAIPPGGPYSSIPGRTDGGVTNIDPPSDVFRTERARAARDSGATSRQPRDS